MLHQVDGGERVNGGHVWPCLLDSLNGKHGLAHVILTGRLGIPKSLPDDVLKARVHVGYESAPPCNRKNVMNDNLWRQLEPHAHQTDEEVERFLSSSNADALKQIVKRAVAILPEGYSVSLDVTLNVFDPERGNVLPLSDTSLTASANQDAYLAYGDCTPCRYLVDGEICEVPHDRCPNCWAGWNFKIGTPDAAPETLECPQ